MKRPFEKYNDNSIIFDNGEIVSFTGEGDTWIDGVLVSVEEFMSHLLSDQYKIDCGYE